MLFASIRKTATCGTELRMLNILKMTFSVPECRTPNGHPWSRYWLWEPSDGNILSHGSKALCLNVSVASTYLVVEYQADQELMYRHQSNIPSNARARAIPEGHISAFHRGSAYHVLWSCLAGIGLPPFGSKFEWLFVIYDLP